MSLDVTREGAVAVVTINRPERKNAFSLEMRRGFQTVFQDLADDNDVRAIVMTGAGGDFSAGADIGEMGDGGVRGSMMKARVLGRMVRGVANTNKPVIAAVEGVCIGASFGVALASDFIIAADNARFQFAFRNIGLALDAAAGWLLERHVGVMRAKEIAYSGRFVSGVEAVQYGFALEALPAGQVLARAMEMAKGLAEGPTLAMCQIKRQFDAHPGQTLSDALDFEGAIQGLMTFTEDFQGASSAFKEKRKPVFGGK